MSAWWLVLAYLAGLLTIPVGLFFYTLFNPYLGR